MLFFAFCSTAVLQAAPQTDNPVQEILQIVPAKNIARRDAPPDTSHVEIRMPAGGALDKFRNDPDFRYTNDFEYSETLWGLIRYYMAKFFGHLLSIDGSDKWLERLWIALLAVVAAFGLFKMLGVDISGIFYRKPPPVDLSEILLDEHADRDKLAAMLEKALAGHQYRLAVRLTYLTVLKRMAEAGQIQWQADKTNRSYLTEIRDQALRDPFRQLTRLYEYVWYGDFDITAEHYRDIEADFDELKRRLR